MRVEVEGLITSLERKEKNEKVYTELMLAQQGEQMQVRVRLEGDRLSDFDVHQIEKFMGRLMTWVHRDVVGMMVLSK